MTHPSSNDPKTAGPQTPGTPDGPAAVRPIPPPPPVPARATSPKELPALPPLPQQPQRGGSVEKPALPPLPKLSKTPAGLPPLPTPPESEEAENVIKVELPSPPMPKVTPIDESKVADRTDADEIRVVLPSTVSQEENGGDKPAEAAVVADQPAPALTDEQQFVLSLSPHEIHTIIEGSAFLLIAVAMADGELDQKEEEVYDAALEKFVGLFESTDALVNEQFEAEFLEKEKEMKSSHETFFSKFMAAQDEAETEKLVTNFMADFSRVLDKAPESVSVKIKNHIRESCLEVAEASGEGPDANICGAEALVIGELLGLLEIDLDEETHSRIFSSLEKQPEEDSTELELQIGVAELEAVKDELLAGKEAELEALKDKLSAESEAFRYLNGLSEQQRADLWFGLIVTPSFVSYADGEQDLQEVMAESEAGEKLGEGMRNWILPSNLSEECSEELLGILLIDLQLKPCLEAIGKGVLRHDSLVIEGTALDRNLKIVDLMQEVKALLSQAPDSLQTSLKEWILESCVRVAEASGSDLEGDDKIGIEERQLLATLFKELDLDYKGTPLEKRLNINQQDQNFRGYMSTLNATDRIRLLALPHVLVEIVAAADGKIDSQEAMQIVPILKEESAALDAEFPVIWRENLKEVQQFGKDLSAEFQSLQGSAKKQLEWVFALLDAYWKILDTMSPELQAKFKTAIANIVTRIAEVSGEGNSVASNIGVEEQLLIDIICESLGIENSPDDQ